MITIAHSEHSSGELKMLIIVCIVLFISREIPTSTKKEFENVSNLRFISRTKFMLSFITSRPGPSVEYLKGNGYTLKGDTSFNIALPSF